MTRITFALFTTIVQYYSYSLFFICAKNMVETFFDKHDSYSWIRFFLVFATGVIAKPIGSILIGYVGDYINRLYALIFSVLMHIVGLSIIICLSYSKFSSIYCMIFLSISRMLLVVGVSTETDVARVYISELIDKKYQNLLNGMLSSSTQLGVLVAFLVSYAIETNNLDWRIAFFIGLISSATLIIISILYFSFWTNYSTRSIDKLMSIVKHKKIHSFDGLISEYSENITLYARFIMILGSIGGIYHFQVIFLYNNMDKFTSKKLMIFEYPMNSKLIFVTCAFILLVFYVLSGLVADKFNNTKRQIKISILMFLFLSCYSFLSLYIFDEFSYMAFFLSIIIMPFFSCPAQVMVKNNIKKSYKYTMFSFNHSVGSMILSSTTPLIASLISSTIGGIHFSYLWLIFLSIILYTFSKFDFKSN